VPARWSRTGAKLFAAVLLLVGLVGGAVLGGARHDQRAAEQQQQAALAAADNLALLRAQAAAQWRASAPQRKAQADAQAKADSAASAAATLAQRADAAAKDAASRSQTRTAPTQPASFGPVPKSCSAYTGNQAIGCSLLLQWGFALSEMPCLVNMWNRESHWRTNAANPSGAYGIPQALPGSKMAVYGSDWQTNPATQIKWGLDYIKGRYSTPCGAWSFWQSHGWY
jgi:hypothetical protein